MYDLSEKSILVTGSTRGIGLAIAKAALSHGARVGIHGRDLDKVKAVRDTLDHPDRIVPLAGDFSDPSSGAQLVTDFLETAGRIDGLVNNAGGGKARAFRAITIESWRETFARNLDSAFTASREAYLTMRKQKSGVILNMASLAAHGPGKWMGADYAASKAGLVSLTKSLAMEAARFNIRVNAISPGMIQTDMTATISDDMRERLDIPMKDLGSPEDVARAAVFLLSDSSSYITGQVLHVNGGLGM